MLDVEEIIQRRTHESVEDAKMFTLLRQYAPLPSWRRLYILTNRELANYTQWPSAP